MDGEGWEEILKQAINNRQNDSRLQGDVAGILDATLSRKLLNVGNSTFPGSEGKAAFALVAAYKLAQYAGGRNIYAFAASTLWPVVKYALTPSPPTNIARKFDPEVPEVTDAERDFYEPTAWASRTTSVLEIMEKRMEGIDNALEKHLPKEKGDDVVLKNGKEFQNNKLTLIAIQKDDSLFRLVDLPSDRFETFIEATRLTKIPPRDLEFLQMFQFLRIQEEYGLTEKEYRVIEKLLGLDVWTGRDDLKNKINKSDAMRFARGKYKV
jgi:hypothetical protein